MRCDGAVDLDLTSDQELFRETTARFIESACPLTTVRALAESETGVDPDYLSKAADLGWFAMLLPEEHGGGSISGEGLRDAAIVAEERGRLLQPGPFVGGNVVAFAVSESGTEAQQAALLPALASGDSTAAWALAGESGDWTPGAGARATPDAGGYVLAGTAGLVQDAHLADWLLVTAADGGGLTQFLLPITTPGLRIEPLQGLDLTRRLCRVGFDGVVVGRSDLLGEPGVAAPAVERQLRVALVLGLAESVGAMDAELTMAVDYAKARTAFGRPIGSFQAVKHLLADTALLLETSKGVLTAAVRAVQDDLPDAGEVASIAKAFVGDAGIDLAQNCWQVFGGIGYTWDHDHHLYLRRLTADTALYGEPAWHRERICEMHGI